MRAAQAQAEALLTLATAQEFPQYVGYGTYWRGWALARQGHGERGIVQIRQGLDALVTGQTWRGRSVCSGSPRPPGRPARSMRGYA